MKKLNGKIRLTRIITNNPNEHYGCIELENIQTKRIVEIHLSIKEFGEFILGRGHVDCEYIKYKDK